MPMANFTEMGYRGFSLPQLDLLFETAFGIRYGLFTPVDPFTGFCRADLAGNRAASSQTRTRVYRCIYRVVFCLL